MSTVASGVSIGGTRRTSRSPSSSTNRTCSPPGPVDGRVRPHAVHDVVAAKLVGAAVGQTRGTARSSWVPPSGSVDAIAGRSGAEIWTAIHHRRSTRGCLVWPLAERPDERLAEAHLPRHQLPPSVDRLLGRNPHRAPLGAGGWSESGAARSSVSRRDWTSSWPLVLHNSTSSSMRIST